MIAAAIAKEVSACLVILTLLARTARLIAATMLGSAVVALTGFAIGAAAVVWMGLIAGCLAWLRSPSGSWPWAGP